MRAACPGPAYPPVRSPCSFTGEHGGSVTVFHGDALDLYEAWPRPTAIVSDGPYGLGKFEGDPVDPRALPEWYAPHVAAWSERALPSTTLWLWCSELGWAELHRLLEANGWEYAGAHVWDKGIGHIAGNCNSRTIRGFPVVTEICVRYVRRLTLSTPDGRSLPVREWLRSEWQRSGLPLSRANVACGVRDAATRKYFTQGHLWYFPPPDKMEALANYAMKHGKPTSVPYFSLDGRTPLTAGDWAKLRAKWNHVHGVTNVWREPAVRGGERVRGRGRKSLHINQKPLRLMELIVRASTDPGDIVWEPFGGLFTGGIAAARLGRHCYAAEISADFFRHGSTRIGRVLHDGAGKAAG